MVSFCALFIIPTRVRFVSLSLSLSFPPPPRPNVREILKHFHFPTFCKGDIDDDDAFADDDFLALLWKKRNDATVVYVHVEIVKALVFFFFIIPFSF